MCFWAFELAAPRGAMQNGQPAQYAEKGQPLNLGWEMTAFVFVHFCTFGKDEERYRGCLSAQCWLVFEEKDAQIWTMTG